jgi:hypothetical protein
MNMSIVIPLGIGSRHNNLELRYCLRSIEKYLTGYSDVFIVGDLPDWLRNVIHIPCPDYGDKTYDKERNIYTKIMAACADERVTDDFLFMNDDHYLLQDYEAGKFPFYCHGWLRHHMTVTDYKHTVTNTMRAFEDSMPYFDIHCPIRYNKFKFEAAMSQLDWSKPFGYCIKTVYGNASMGVDAISYPDLKIKDGYSAAKILELIADRSWFSIGDGAFDGDIRYVLQALYPHKSKYE